MSYTTKLIKELLPIFFLISLSLLSTTGALGQAYPTRPITLVVPYAAGSGLDPLARTIAANLAPRLGQPIVIDFKAGAGSAIGSDFAARSAPNGYTLILTTVALPVLPALYKNLQFDPIKDFTHISKIATGSMALVVNPKQLPVKTLDELVSRAKAQPGKLNYGSAGNATPHHLGMEMFKHELGLDIVHVPYKGATGALNDLLGGQIPMAMFPVNVVLPFVRDGRLTVLAVSGRGRSLLAPDAPSFEELGLKNLDIDVYYFISGPAKLSPEIVGQLNAEIAKTLDEVRTPLRASGLVAERSSPDAITEHIKNDMVRWKDLITKARITAE